MNRLFYMLWALSFAITGLVWIEGNNNPLTYLHTAAPAGQLPYVLSKLCGLLALTSFCWQAILGMAARSDIPVKHDLHMTNGSLLVGTLLSHVALFVLAVSLRTGALNLGPLSLNFADYFHRYLAFGVIAIMIVASSLLIPAAITAFVGGHAYRWIHAMSVAAVPLAFIHSAAIGSDTANPIYVALIIALCTGCLAIACLRGRQGRVLA